MCLEKRPNPLRAGVQVTAQPAWFCDDARVDAPGRGCFSLPGVGSRGRCRAGNKSPRHKKRDGLWREKPKPPQRPGDCEMRLHCPERHPPGGEIALRQPAHIAQPWSPILSWNEGTDYGTEVPPLIWPMHALIERLCRTIGDYVKRVSTPKRLASLDPLLRCVLILVISLIGMF